MATVELKIPLGMRKLTNGHSAVKVSGDSIQGLIADLERQHPGVLAKLMDDDGNLRSYMNIFVNGDDIRYRGGLAASISDGDRVQIIPAAAGGCI